MTRAMIARVMRQCERVKGARLCVARLSNIVPKNCRARAALITCVLCMSYASTLIAIAQTLSLDPPSTPAWPTPSSVNILADALMIEADKLDAHAQSPSAPAAWRRLAATILRAHGAAPLANSSPVAIALVMAAIRHDMDANLNTPAAELFAAEWNARADPHADPMPEFARILAGITELPATESQSPPCEEAKELLKQILPVATAANTAPDLVQSTAEIISAANQAAATLCAINNAAFENAATRKKIAVQVNDAIQGLNDPTTRAESIAQCGKIGAFGECIQALNQFRSVAGSTSAARSDRIPDALRALYAKKDAVDAARSLNRVAQIISWMAQTRQINVDAIAPPLRNFARLLTRHAKSQEKLGLARIESLSQNGFDANDPSLTTIFVAQEQLVSDINMLERLSLALSNIQKTKSMQTKQLTAVLQRLCAGLDDSGFSDLFRERLRSMDRQLCVLLAAENTPNLSAGVQAKVPMIHQAWLDAWAQNNPVAALKSIEDFVRWTGAKRAMDALDAAPIDWPDARLDWAASRDALRLSVIDCEGCIANENFAAMKQFLVPLRKEAAASLALGLRLSAKSKDSSGTSATIRNLCSMQNDKSIQVIAAMLRLEQERQTLQKTNPTLAAEFLIARNEWVAELPPALQDRLPDGLLPPATP